MPNVTTSVLRTRVQALVALVPGLEMLGNEKELPDKLLPAAEVLIGQQVTSARVDMRTRLVTYQWEIWLYVQRVERPDVWSVVDEAIDACDPWIDTIPDFFKARPRLELSDSGLVRSTGEMTISRGIFPYRGSGKDYSGCRFVLPVTVARYSA